MPRGTELTDEERGLIKGMSQSGMKVGQIAASVKRHRNTIMNFLKNPNNYGATKRSGRISTIDNRSKRRIQQLATNIHMSCRQIKVELGLNATKQRVHQIIRQDLGLKYENRVPKPRLKQHHKIARIAFYEKYKFWEEEFESVIFSDEKIFNLDGPDGLQKYWRDVRRPRESCHKRVHGGGSLMVWAAFSVKGKSKICFVPGKMSADVYIDLLESELLDFAGDLHGDEWIFQQDNAPIHAAKKTRAFFDSRQIELLEWPALSPDLNPIEDLWGILSA